MGLGVQLYHRAMFCKTQTGKSETLKLIIQMERKISPKDDFLTSFSRLSNLQVVVVFALFLGLDVV